MRISDWSSDVCSSDLRFSCGRAFHRLAELLVVDSDRIGRGIDRAIADMDHPVLVDPPTQLALDIMAEGFQPFLGLEADHVIGKQSAHQPLVIGERDQQPRGRPGDMQEEADPVLEAAVAKLLAERDQMIVVDPDEVVGFYKRRDSLREALIDPLIAAAEAAVIFGEDDPVMEEWPQRPVDRKSTRLNYSH